MDLATIEQLLDLVGRSAIRELELSRDGWRIRLSKGASAGAPPAACIAPAADAEGPRPVPPPASVPAASRSHTVAAGLTGVFYRAPAPGQQPFVSEGDRVEEGQKLGILEAMKTLIPIEADCAGQVTAILVADGTPVGMGDALFSLEPTDPA